MFLLGSDLEKLQTLKESGEWDEAIALVNRVLAKDPSNEEALLQIADINYRRGFIENAEKAVDFLNATKGDKDPMGMYVKGVLAMEKTEWKEARQYLHQANELTHYENHEIMRCYGLCNYWYGNREKGLQILEMAYYLNEKDAEVVYNLIEIYLLEYNYSKAREMITYYFSHREDLQMFDKDVDYYDHKIELFDTYVQGIKGVK